MNDFALSKITCISSRIHAAALHVQSLKGASISTEITAHVHVDSKIVLVFPVLMPIYRCTIHQIISQHSSPGPTGEAPGTSWSTITTRPLRTPSGCAWKSPTSWWTASSGRCPCRRPVVLPCSHPSGTGSLEGEELALSESQGFVQNCFVGGGELRRA